MRHIVLGVLAHVDSGKTTLSEAMMYLSGSLARMGRVDHQDAYLDTNAMEKDRGITIFSKQAEFEYKDIRFTLMDTPGHVDFGAEMERVLQILDYAVLVINGMEGVQSHTETLWKLLARYGVPTFVFVNKMDMSQLRREDIMEDVRARLGDGCVDFCAEEASEQIAMCDERMLEHYLESGENAETDVKRAVAERKLFPCIFGSALKADGVDALLDAIAEYADEPCYSDEFGARVFKIGRDEKGERLTYMKVVGGSLHLKDILQLDDEHGEVSEEKVNQIRIYSGNSYRQVNEAHAGDVCAVPGLVSTRARQGIGACENSESPNLAPVLTYKVIYPDDVDAVTMAVKLRQLEEEDPQLAVETDDACGDIYIKVMGQVQLEVLARMVSERYGIAISYGQGRIAYRETIEAPVMGVGHFEPLRHYAEVHLLLEPLPAGSGLCYETACSEDVLSRNWQRLVMTHLAEREHRGVLTGSPITDVRITLTSGRAHNKHTEGGDFRQATYRAVRQGLMMANSVLLEPVYAFRIEVPHEFAGRVLADIVRMSGRMDGQEIAGEITVITGRAPVSTMREYYTELTAFSRGTGRLSANVDGYEPCHNTDEVLAERGYDPESDMRQPVSSVFCAHGAGYIVPWNEVYGMMQVKEDAGFEVTGQADCITSDDEEDRPRRSGPVMDITEDELTEIFARTYGGKYKSGGEAEWRYRDRYGSKADMVDETRKSAGGRSVGAGKTEPGCGIDDGTSASGGNTSEKHAYWNRNRARSSTGQAGGKGTLGVLERKKSGEDYLIVDGYNVIFAWSELKELAAVNIDSARDKLLDILSNYQGFVGRHVTAVFDGYKVSGNKGTQTSHDAVEVVFTKEGETADAYIERLTNELARKHRVTVVTSDGLEQLVTMGQGAMRMSSRDFKAEVARVEEEIRGRL